jgi:drug/metabolite transporter (DMT)-like permease
MRTSTGWSDAHGVIVIDSRRGVVLALLAATCFASLATGISVVSKTVSVPELLGLRGAVGTALLAAAFRNDVRRAFVPEKATAFVWLRGLCVVVSFGCQYVVFQAGKASLGVATTYVAPLGVALFSFVFIGLRPRRAEWIGLGFCAAGAALIFVDLARGV